MSLPAVLIIAIVAAVLVSRREHPELALPLTVVAYVSFFATLVWWDAPAPWNGDL
jgi:hypothetical protein